jgi:hypothetical protein
LSPGCQWPACFLALPTESGHDAGRLFMLLDELESQSIYILRDVLIPA